MLILVFIGVCSGVLVTSLAGERVAGWIHADKVFVQHAASFAFIQGLALVWITWFLRDHDTNWVDGFGLDRAAAQSIVIGIVTIFVALPIAMIFIGALVLYLLKLFGIEPEVQPTVTLIKASASVWQDAVLAFAAMVLAPVAEEAIFRGVLYPAFRNRGHRWVGLWVTAFLFGAIHVNLAAFIPLTFLAIVFTWLYERTGNLLAPIAAHSVFNTINFLLLVAPPDWKWLQKLMTQ